MAKLTEVLNIAVTPQLKAAIKQRALEEKRKYTELARLELERVFLADEVTIRMFQEAERALADSQAQHQTEAR